MNWPFVSVVVTIIASAACATYNLWHGEYATALVAYVAVQWLGVILFWVAVGCSFVLATLRARRVGRLRFFKRKQVDRV